MSRAYIIEVNNRTAGIVTGDERGFSFFSSERMFDSLEGRQFGSAPNAELAARCSMPSATRGQQTVGSDERGLIARSDGPRRVGAAERRGGIAVEPHACQAGPVVP
jgi:hypothetical protein